MRRNLGPRRTPRSDAAARTATSVTKLPRITDIARCATAGAVTVGKETAIRSVLISGVVTTRRMPGSVRLPQPQRDGTVPKTAGCNGQALNSPRSSPSSQGIRVVTSTISMAGC
jgi:hypothetical protein